MSLLKIVFRESGPPQSMLTKLRRHASSAFVAIPCWILLLASTSIAKADDAPAAEENKSEKSLAEQSTEIQNIEFRGFQFLGEIPAQYSMFNYSSDEPVATTFVAAEEKEESEHGKKDKDDKKSSDKKAEGKKHHHKKHHHKHHKHKHGKKHGQTAHHGPHGGPAFARGGFGPGMRGPQGFAGPGFAGRGFAGPHGFAGRDIRPGTFGSRGFGPPAFAAMHGRGGDSGTPFATAWARRGGGDGPTPFGPQRGHGPQGHGQFSGGPGPMGRGPMGHGPAGHGPGSRDFGGHGPQMSGMQWREHGDQFAGHRPQPGSHEYDHGPRGPGGPEHGFNRGNLDNNAELTQMVRRLNREVGLLREELQAMKDHRPGVGPDNRGPGPNGPRMRDGDHRDGDRRDGPPRQGDFRGRDRRDDDRREGPQQFSHDDFDGPRRGFEFRQSGFIPPRGRGFGGPHEDGHRENGPPQGEVGNRGGSRGRGDFGPPRERDFDNDQDQPPRREFHQGRGPRPDLDEESEI